MATVAVLGLGEAGSRLAVDLVAVDIQLRTSLLTGLTQVGCDADGVATGGASKIVGLALSAGQTYYFQLGGYKNTNTRPKAAPVVVKDNALAGTSAWANTFLGRDHHAR